jgi:hypothetical protein
MPWEVDDAILSFDKFAQAQYYLDEGDNVYFDTCLNLSSYLIDWDNSKLPKEFFVDKYKHACAALHKYKTKHVIYDGDELYGHLDLQKNAVEPHIDYYISACPDTYFHSHLVCYMIAFAKTITNRYFLITPEISQLWDDSWDILVNENRKHITYATWEDQDINDVIYTMDNKTTTPYIEKIDQYKWAGWFDLYSKSFYEQLVPFSKDWKGYGPWDLFGMNACNIARQYHKTDIQQYVLRNQLIFDRKIGSYKNSINPNVYKKYLSLKQIPNQRVEFEKNLSSYIKTWYKHSVENNIL